MNPIAKMLIDMAKFYDQALDERQLAMYVDALSKAPFDLVLKAGKEYVQDSRNTRFPIPPHKILDRYLPNRIDSKDLARETAMRIRHAVTKFGWPNPDDARAHIGETGWVTVERLGGWQHLCENLGGSIQETTFMAQCRDAIEANINLERLGIDTTRPAADQTAVADLGAAIRGRLGSMPEFTPQRGNKPGLATIGEILKQQLTDKDKKNE